MYSPRQKNKLGGASQINAELRLLEEVVNNENALSEPYTFIHYLQGADLPLKSQEYIHSFFDAKEGQQFVSFSTGSTQELRDRSQYRHFLADTPWFRYNKVIKAINKGFVAVQKGLGIKRNTDIRLFYGSALWSITSSFAHYLVLRRNEIKKRFRVSLAADEVFIQTILMDSPFKKEIAKEGNLRLINWQLPHPKNSPHTWEKKDWPLLRASSAEVIFARKFNETVDMEIVKLVEAFVTDSGI